MIQAFPDEKAPRFLVRDRDKIYCESFQRATKVLGIEEVVTAAPAAPAICWQAGVSGVFLLAMGLSGAV